MKDRKTSPARTQEEVEALRAQVAELQRERAAWADAEREHRQTEQRLRLLSSAMEQSNAGIATSDLQGNLLFANDAFAAMHGYSPQEVIGRHLSIFHTPEQMPAVEASMREILERGEFNGEIWHARRDGSTFPSLMHNSLLRDERGEPVGMVATMRDISERKRAEQELRASESLRRTAINATKEAMIAIDQEALITVFNPAAEKMFGRRRKEMIGQPLDCLMPEPYRRPHREHVASYFATGKPNRAIGKTVELPGLRSDGTEFPMGISLAAGRYDDKRFVIAVARDITERKRAERQLQESRQMLQLVLDNIPQRIFWKDCDSVYRGCNSNFADDAGVEGPEDIDGKTDYDLPWKKKEAESFRSRDHAVMETGKPQYRMVEPVRQASGREALVETTKVPLRDADGKVVGILGTYEDITERRQAEERLRESEALYRAVFEQAGDTIVLCDPQTGAIVEFNDRAHDNLGYTREEFQGLSLTDIDALESTQDVVEHLRKVREGEIGSFETKHRTKGGDLRDVLVTARAVAAGQKELIVAVWRDITERKAGERKLQESKQMLQLVLDNIPQRIFWKDRNSTYGGGNKMFVSDAGVEKPEDLQGKTDYDLPWKREEADFFRQCDRRVMDRDTPEYGIVEPEFRADGTQAWVETNKVPLHDAAGKVTGILGTYEDITEKLALEEQMRQAQRMESIGTLTSGIAHDFNNLLTVIMGNASFLLNKTEQDSALYRPLQDVVKASERAGSLIQQLLAFSRKAVLQMRPLDLRRCVDDTLTLLRPGFDRRIEIPPPSSVPSLWSVRADRGQINQVIMNLCVNARDAMPTGGTLRIETKNTVIDQAYCQTNSKARPGEYVELMVTDTGTGMDKKTMDRMFEPFFTTKRPGLGTGLGLATVDGIIGQHGGWITVASKRRRGTSFHIFLPRAEEAPKETPARAPVPIPRGTETILVVEDEPLVRDVAKRILTECGYHTVEAEDGEQALQMFQDYGQEIDLVLLDITLPKMDGHEVLVAIRRLDPDAKVILCSGRPASDTAPKTKKLAAGIPLLCKPVSNEELARTVRKVLDS